MRSILLTAALVIALCALTGCARRGYVKGGVGYLVGSDLTVPVEGGFIGESFDPGYAFYVGGGVEGELGGPSEDDARRRRLREGAPMAYRVEAEALHRATEGDVAGGDLDFTSLNLNLIGVVAPDAGLSPYLGFGVGASLADYSDPIVSEDDTSFNIQALGGLLFGQAGGIQLDLGVRYIHAPHEFGDVDNVNIDDVVFSLGIIIPFGREWR